jgi:hypothetical protein
VTGSAMAPLLAHAGAGSSWQALLVGLSFGLMVVALLVVVGRIELRGVDDLVLPLAAVAIVSSLAPLADELLSDWAAWAAPAGAVVLIGLLLGALTPLELRPLAPLTVGIVVGAVVAGVLLDGPLTRAWHPTDFAPDAGEVEIAFVVPQDGDVIEAGTVEVALVITGGTIGPGGADAGEVSAPTEAGTLLAWKSSPPGEDWEEVEVDPLEDCTVTDPCTTVTFPVELEAGSHGLRVEFRTADGGLLDPMVTDRVDFESR